MPYSIKRNTCKYQGCEGFIWARGLCKNHDRRENPHKHGKPKTTSKIVKNYVKKTTGEKALFEALWLIRPHVSFVSDERVEPIAHTFAHCIPKSLYPKFRLNPRNIVFLTPEQHYAFDFMSEEDQRKLGGDWDKLYTLRDELLKEYRKL